MKKHFLLLILSLLFLPIAQGKVKLPAMMGDHMVLQQNSSVKLWGWADGKKGGILLIPLLSVTELRSLSRIY